MEALSREVSVADLRARDLKKLLDGAQMHECRSFAPTLVLGFSFDAGESKELFRTHSWFADIGPDDILTPNYSALEEWLPEVEEPEIAAWVADLLWTTRRGRVPAHAHGRVAVSKYIAMAHGTSPSSSTGLTCTNATCPFYLGNLAAWNYTSTWDVRIYESSTVYYPKSISNVDISLVRSAMGIQRMSNGRLAFPVGALEFIVSFDIDSCLSCSDFGNGHYSFLIKNSTVVFGTVGSSGISLNYSFPVNLAGTATLNVVTTNVESPPVASTVSTTTVACNRPGGYLLDLSWSTSTDPDSDLDVSHWLVDGKWRSSRTILPVGTHSVRLETTDVRGAVRRTAPKTVIVTAGAACP